MQHKSFNLAGNNAQHKNRKVDVLINQKPDCCFCRNQHQTVKHLCLLNVKTILLLTTYDEFILGVGLIIGRNKEKHSRGTSESY